MSKRKLPPWCRRVKHAMIDKGMGTKELGEALGYTRQYVAAIVNGRVYVETAVKRISDFLCIDSEYDAEDQ